MTHLAIAAKQGMKAGFNAYTRTLVRGNLPQVVETRETLERMGKRAAFAWYCAKHGPDVTALIEASTPEPKNVTTKSSRKLRIAGTRKAASSPLAAEIEAARARLAELEAQAAQPKVTRSSKPATAKENLWREWAVRKHNIPAQVGATFTYKGKRRTSTFKVTRVTSEGVYSVRVA